MHSRALSGVIAICERTNEILSILPSVKNWVSAQHMLIVNGIVCMGELDGYLIYLRRGWILYLQKRVAYRPYVSPFDPCPPQKVKTYIVPPNQFLGFQPPDLPQFKPFEALRHGTLWPVLYSPYKGRDECEEQEDSQ